MTAMPTPAELMIFLSEKAMDMDDLGKQLEAAHLDLGEKEAAYEEARDEAIVELVEEHEQLGKKLPGEDVRLALARKRIGFQLYKDYKQAKRRVEALEVHARKMETAITARQSTLKGLQEEARLPNVDPRTGEVIGGRR